MPDLSTYLSTIASSAQAIANAASTESSERLTRIQATSAYQSLLPAQQAEILSALEEKSAVASEAQTILTQVSSLQASLSQIDTSGQGATIVQLQGAANQLLPAASTSLSSLSSGLTQASTALGNQIVPASQEIATGVTTLQTKLSEGANQLQAGVQQYTDAVSQLSEGAYQLTTNSPQLVEGANQLQAGASILDTKSGQMISGAEQLATGVAQITSGSQQLAKGGEGLTDGLSSLNKGATSLTNGLTDAHNQLTTLSTKDENATRLSSPLALNHKDTDKVKNNGVGMAPYMMSVALMVAALSTNMIFAGTASGKEPKSRIDWVARKLAVNGVIAVFAATILYVAVHFIGLTANDEWKTYFITVLASVTFMAMVTAFYNWHERFGAFLSLLVLLLQLASSAGTYPLPLTARFFQVIHPFLPMSYTVSGLRQTISMTGQVTNQIMVLSLFSVLLMGLGAGLYKRNSDNR